VNYASAPHLARQAEAVRPQTCFAAFIQYEDPCRNNSFDKIDLIDGEFAVQVPLWSKTEPRYRNTS
jgi:hypothetical protein